MPHYIRVASGNFDTAAAWDIGVGYPNVNTDTWEIGVFDVTVQIGLSVVTGAGSLTGTGTATRSKLTILGSLKVEGTFTVNAYNQLAMGEGAVFDYGSIDITASGALRNVFTFVGSPLNRAKVISTTGTGDMRRAGADVSMSATWQYVDFGFIKNFASNFVSGDTFWLWMRFWVPSNWTWNTNGNGLKFFRFGYPGYGPELDTYIADGQEYSVGDTTQMTGIHLVNESFPQLQANTHRQTSRIFTRGAWNTVCKMTQCSTSQASSAERLWINDQFVYEHVGGASQVTTKWWNSTLQTASWTPSGSWATLNVANAISNFYLSSYWNNTADQDQALNIDKIIWHNVSGDLLTDEYANPFIHSSQVA